MTKVKQPYIKVSTEQPPNWAELEKTFNVKWIEDGMAKVVAYGDTIHCSLEPSEDVLQHEMCHLKQQGFTKKGAEKWWKKYMKDPEFRLSQEIEAYQRQYQVLSLYIKDRNYLAKQRVRLAKDLSSSMYGNIVSYSEALRAIRV